MANVSFVNELGAHTTLHYDDQGFGKPVVCIHGYPLDGSSWEKQTTTLLAQGYRVITYDRRGFGRSSHLSEGYNYDAFAGDLDQLLRHLNLREATLIGFSMGSGEIARYMKLFGPERIKATVFIGCLEPYLRKTEENPDGAVTQEFIDDFSATVAADRYAFFTQFFENFFNTAQLLGSRVSEEALRHHWDVASSSGTIASIKAPFTWLEDFRQDIPAVTVPSLIVHGTEDNILPIDATARRFKHLLPDARYVEIEGAPHGLLWTHADEVNTHLLRFLQDTL
ncbi:alpha/beta fold hydrolase [Timonella sp. A28]|uniref:alpha/beta fold hydrolase n=1 Tax=Timonella sp. A28 TaxID=3442640 RepID=UPI003EBE1CEA